MSKKKLKMTFVSAITVLLIVGIGNRFYGYYETESHREIQNSQQAKKHVMKKKTKNISRKVTNEKNTSKSEGAQEALEKETEGGAYINENTLWILKKLPITEIQKQNMKIKICNYIDQQKLGMIRGAYLWRTKGIQQYDTMSEFFVICQMTDGYYVTFDVRAYNDTKNIQVTKVLADYHSPEPAGTTSRKSANETGII